MEVEGKKCEQAWTWSLEIFESSDQSPLLFSPRGVGKSTFREDYPEAIAIALYRGSERLRIDDVWCLPVADFLRHMRPDRALLSMPGRGDAL